MHRRPAVRERRRRGMALVAALGLLLLGAALLAGTAVASLELRRATRGRVAAARAESEARRALGTVVQGWDAVADSLPVGAVIERTLSPPAGSGPVTVPRARVRRLAAHLYLASVTVRVGDGAHGLAFRRVRLLLERAPGVDSANAPRAVMPLSRWRVVDMR